MEWVEKWILMQPRLRYLYDQMNCGTISNEEYKELQYLVVWKYILSDSDFHDRKIQEQVSVLNIDEDKVMFIADTHVGHDTENQEYIQNAYNAALQLGFSTVIHAGDAIEGAMDCRCSQIHETFGEKLGSYEHFKGQLDRFLSFLPDPEKDGIQTKLLLGNHDYWAIRHAPLLINDFFDSKRLDILGIKKVLLNFQKELLIGVYHGVSQKELPMERDEVVSLTGHSHLYAVDEAHRLIRIPQLSDDFKDGYASMLLTGYVPPRSSIPLFISMERVDQDLIHFCQYSAMNFQIINIVDEVVVHTKTKELVRMKR